MIIKKPMGYPIPFTGRPYPVREMREIPWEAYVYMGHHAPEHVIPDPENDKTGRVLNLYA